MSSGLILLNKNGAAIAADSAVTLGNRSAIYNTARKIFEIGDAPVLVVITGSIGVLGVPIEVILKQFSIYARKHSLLKEKLSDYGIELMRFLEEKSYE
jgi:ATP-dependent protease HslVU (ClpYQ) peptidase subunit